MLGTYLGAVGGMPDELVQDGLAQIAACEAQHGSYFTSRIGGKTFSLSFPPALTIRAGLGRAWTLHGLAMADDPEPREKGKGLSCGSHITRGRADRARHDRRALRSRSSAGGASAKSTHAHGRAHDLRGLVDDDRPARDRPGQHLLVREHDHARDPDHERRSCRRADGRRTRRPARRSTPPGIVEKPVNFTRNTLAVVVPKSNPAGIKSIYDLTKPGVKVDVAASSVPVGSYTVQVLNQMGLNSRDPGERRQPGDLGRERRREGRARPGRRRLRLPLRLRDQPDAADADQGAGMGAAEDHLRDVRRDEEPEPGGGAGLGEHRS